MELRHEFDLEVLLSQTNMARSSFYYHQKQLDLPDKYKEIKELNDIKRQEELNEKLNPAFGEVVGFKAVNNF